MPAHLYTPHADGPLWRYEARRKNRRTVTVPKGVSAHVKFVFAEMARQGRSYDEIESASGVRRATAKAWRRKNAPGWESLTAVLNSMGWCYLPAPVQVEALPPALAARLAEVAALAKAEMPEVFAATVEICARQIIASEGSARILAEIDAEREAHEANRHRKPKPPANDNTKQPTAIAI